LALNLNTTTDVDYFMFTPSSKGTFRISIQFKNASGNLDLFLYDSQQRLLASGTSTADNETISLALAAGQRYYLKVISPTGATNAYDLSVTKLSGSTKLRSSAALVTAPKHSRKLDVRHARAELS
jgi:hypothetical protein